MVAVSIRIPTFTNDLKILKVSGHRRPSHRPLTSLQASPPPPIRS